MKRLILVVVLCLSMVSIAYAQGITSTLQDKATGLAKDKATEKATAYTDDATVTADVKLALANADALKDAKIEVTTTKGVVTLAGTVKTAKAKFAAPKIAKAVKGVKKVTNKLTIEKPAKKVKKA